LDTISANVQIYAFGQYTIYTIALRYFDFSYLFVNH